MEVPRIVRRNSRVNRPACKEVIFDYLADYLESRLDAEAVADFERHLENCAACRAYLATYAKTPDVVGHAGRVAMPPEMKAHVRRFLLAQFTDVQP